MSDDDDTPLLLPARFSYLKAMGRCAAKCRQAMIADSKQTVSRERGSATHAMIFGTAPVLGYAEGRPRRGKDWDAFQTEHPGAHILTAAEYERVGRMVQAIYDHHEARDLLLAGTTKEQTQYFDFLGRRCRTTPDAFARDRVCELKTAKSTDPEEFPWQSRRYVYHGQHAFHVIGCEAAGHGRLEPYTVSVEPEPPYVITIFRYTPRALDIGERFVRLQLERLIQCEATNEWPGYSQSIVDIDVADDDDDIGLIYAEDDTEAA